MEEVKVRRWRCDWSSGGGGVMGFRYRSPEPEVEHHKLWSGRYKLEVEWALNNQQGEEEAKDVEFWRRRWRSRIRSGGPELYGYDSYKKDMNHSSQLGKALHDWRKAEFSQHYPDWHNSIWIGDWIVLGNPIIDNIIYLMNCNKLLNQQDFIQLIDWEERGYYASELLPMIHQIFPPAVPPSAQPSTPAQSNTVVQPCMKKCGNCKNMATMRPG
ncbi:uncharacterized protein EI90DRAFT_3134786 [Cantharellus anzutake]|uniref:uncharacterized protein n=1 Tax=Cantharellus anzutake TaxID=1750568 RepID=UPI001906DD2E|nr:uncharacterized protein EI90DRAFT_3134786 [Cantharellus anzutake]KAF8316016.1 hypothetical protein EI90DRAFT_3134786 [Cantharellus anzutake]